MLTEHSSEVAPNTYWVAKKRPPSRRAVHDQELKVAIARVHADNLSAYGVDKVWTQLNREGTRVARCTVERLMRELGLCGAGGDGPTRSRRMPMTASTAPTTSSTGTSRHRAPNRLWVAD